MARWVSYPARPDPVLPRAPRTCQPRLTMTVSTSGTIPVSMPSSRSRPTTSWLVRCSCALFQGMNCLPEW